MDRNCQNCDKPVEESWTLCKACRRGYARLLHRLRVNLYRLQSVARREYRLTEPGNGGRPQGGDAPAPVDLHAVDLLDQTEQAIEQACADAGTWLGRWQWLAKRAPVILPLLCRASNAGWHMRRLTRACERIERIVDRMPRSRRIVGMCPECGREVLAAKGETLRLCKCGAVIDVAELREQSRDKAEAIHLTKTPAGMSEWLRENYGYEVSRKVIIMWIRRGKLPRSKPVEDGYYEFSIREIVSMAMAYSSRQ